MGDETQSPQPRFEQKPGRYLDRPTQSDGSNVKRSVVARARRELAPSSPDTRSPKVGGRWQEENGNFNMLINQAGEHVECWVTQNSSVPGGPRPAFRLGGDRKDDKSFTLYVYPDKDKFSGTIKRLSDTKLQVELTQGGKSSTDTLVPNDPKAPGRPTLSDAALAVLPPEGATYKLNEHFPLTRQERSFLKRKLSTAALGPKIRAWLAVGNGNNVADRIARERRAKSLDDEIGAVFTRWHAEALPLVQERARHLLSVDTLTHELTERSLREWLEQIVKRTEEEGFNAVKTPNIQRYLGLRPSSREKPFRYDVELIALGFAGDVVIGLGGFVGAIIITKRDGPEEDAPVLFRQEYEAWFGGVSAGYSGGFQLGFRTAGHGISFADHVPSDIPGWMTMLDAGGKAAGGVGPGASFTALEIHGDGSQPKLFIDLTGETYNAGLGFGVELGMSGGRILKIGNKFKKRKPDTRLPSTDYAVEAKMDALVHFELGDAFVKDQEGRALLRVFCAVELACLMSEGSSLDCEGHADRLDSKERNDELSLLRAKNTLAAIRDILGPDLKIRSDHITSRGLGERRAEALGEPDGSINPNFRKVELVLDARLSVTLSGE